MFQCQRTSRVLFLLNYYFCGAAVAYLEAVFLYLEATSSYLGATVAYLRFVARYLGAIHNKVKLSFGQLGYF